MPMTNRPSQEPGSTLLTLRIPRLLLRAIDEAAREVHASRSGFIRETVVMRLNRQRLVHEPDPEDILELLRRTNPDNGG